MSGRPPSDPGSADAKPAEAPAGRSTDSEIDAAFAAATSEKPPRVQQPLPRRPAGTLVGIAPPVLPALPEPPPEPAVPVEPAPPVKRVMTESEEASPDSDAALTLRRALPSDLRTATSSEKPATSSEKPAQAADERPIRRSFRAKRSPSFGRVMTLKVRFLGGEASLWAVTMALLVPLLLLAAFGGAALTLARKPRPAVAAAAPSAAPPSADSSNPVASAAPSASAVSQLELSELEAKPAGSLTSDQVLARAAGRLEREISVAKGLRQNIEREPDAIKQKSMLLALRKLTANPGTAPEALGSIASLPGTLGPDLLYEIWVSKQSRPEAAELARELLYSSDVRPKASPALGAVLDLRASTSCEEAKAAVDKALESGDRRSLLALSKLVSKRGCGPTKRDDCYPCLRDGDEIKTAAAAVKKRRAPTPFSVP